MFTTGEIIGIVLGTLSIVIAIGLGWHLYNLDKNRRKDEESYFSEIIKQNIVRITGYYDEIEQISQNDRYSDEVEISKNLNDYYSRKITEMKDLISYTSLYLTQWKSLKIDDKKTIEKNLKKFSWLIYDYYPMHLSLATRNREWQTKVVDLSKYKEEIMLESEIINNI